MNRIMMVGLVAMTLNSISFGGEPTSNKIDFLFNSKEARAIQLGFEDEKKSLDESYFKELAAIKKTYVTGLSLARKHALDRNELDEAQLISNFVKDFDSDDLKSILPEKGLKLTSKELIGRKFLFSYSGKTNYYPVMLGKDGKLIGGQGPNECFWKVSPLGKFTLIGQDMKTTSSWNYEIYTNPKGMLMLSGKSLMDAKDCLLHFQEYK